MEKYEDVYQELEDGGLKKIERGGFTRPLTSFEAIHFKIRKMQYVMHQYIEIESQHPIERSAVETAVELLMIKNPVLQLTGAKNAGKYWFKLREELSFNLEFQSGDVDEIFRRNFNYRFDLEREPLWKIIFTYPIDENVFRYGIILIIDHTISDVASNYILLGYLSRYLAKDQTLINRTATPLPNMMLKPLAVSNLLGIQNAFRYWPQMASWIVRHNSPSRSHIYKNIEHEGGDPSLLALYETLTEADTRRLLQKCKANGVSVNSCIAVAASISMIRATNEKQRSEKRSHHLIVGVPINNRQYFPETHSDVVGCYVGMIHQPLKSTEHLDETFWSRTKAFHDKMGKGIRTKSWRLDRLFPYVVKPLLKKNIRNSQESKQLIHSFHFGLNNMGCIDKYFQLPEDSTLKVVSVRRMAFDMNWFTPLMLGVDTFRSRIQLKVNYTEMNILTKDVQAIFQHLLAILKEIVENEKF